MKLLAKSPNGKMFKIENEVGSGYTWYTLDGKVAEFATKIEIGSELDITLEEKNGEKIITFIKSKGAGKHMSETTDDFKCITCGAKLKNGTYKTCYTCSMEARKKEEASPEGQTKQTSIEKQAVLKASANAVATAMQGQIPDPDTLASMIITVYNKLYPILK